MTSGGAAAQPSLPAADLLPPQSESGLVQPATSAEAPRGGHRSIDVGPSTWLLLPLGLIGATLCLVSGASFINEARERRRKPEEVQA